jgi:hypothetical protein
MFDVDERRRSSLNDPNLILKRCIGLEKCMSNPFWKVSTLGQAIFSIATAIMSIVIDSWTIRMVSHDPFALGLTLIAFAVLCFVGTRLKF